MWGKCYFATKAVGGENLGSSRPTFTTVIEPTGRSGRHPNRASDFKRFADLTDGPKANSVLFQMPLLSAVASKPSVHSSVLPDELTGPLKAAQEGAKPLSMVPWKKCQR